MHTREVVRWSTDAVSPSQRFGYYEDALARTLTPLRISSDMPDRLSATIAMVDAGPLSVLHMSGSPHRAHRGPPEIARSSARTFHLLVNRSSSWTIDHRGRARMGIGDLVLTDSGFDHALDLPRAYDVINLKLSESWLRQWLPHPDMLVGRRIAAGAGWAEALSAFVARLTADAVTSSPLPSRVLVDQLGGLLSLVAGSGTRATTDRAIALDLHARVLDLVAARCEEPSLTAVDVAASLQVSVRTVYRCLAARDETFGALLMATRADRAIAMLRSSLARRLTIAEIGRRAGFVDASHFARVLRRRAGQGPMQIRDETSARPSNCSTADS